MNAVLVVRLIIVGALLAVLPACSTTDVQSVRHPAAMGGGQVRNVIVIGVDQRAEVRDPFENDAVRFLQERGVQGTASYTRFSFDEIKGDKEQIRQKLQGAGAESLLFARVTQRTDFVD